MNMNNNKVWAVVAIVVLAGAWYFYSGSGVWKGGMWSTATTTVDTSAQSETGQPSATSPVKKAGTTQKVAPAKVTGLNPIAYLYSLKEPLVCSMKTTSGYARAGTMYIANGKMRANLGSSAMIADGMYLYAWAQGASTGLKLLAATSASGSAIAAAGGFDPATPVSYSCNPWVADASVFTPPTGVSFSNTY
ncbi:MAG: hypothetical protein WAV50_01365 [Minisyncoccia bacterium]